MSCAGLSVKVYGGIALLLNLKREYDKTIESLMTNPKCRILKWMKWMGNISAAIPNFAAVKEGPGLVA